MSTIEIPISSLEEELHSQNQEHKDWYQEQLHGQKRLPRKQKKRLKRELQQRLVFSLVELLIQQISQRLAA